MHKQKTRGFGPGFFYGGGLAAEGGWPAKNKVSEISPEMVSKSTHDNAGSLVLPPL